jgi:hypothetical protein
MPIHWYAAAGLLMLLSPAARPADEPLKISTYATAGAVNRYMNTPEGRQNVVAVLKRFRISKVYVEGNRGDVWVPVDLLRAVRDDLTSQGFETSGGAGPLPGKTFGVHVSGRQPWLDFRAQKTQQDVARAFTESAAVFDEMIVDDFYCFDEGPSPQYRRDLLVGLIDPMMLKPARAVRPSFRLIIKIPQWYDRFQEYGYEPVGMTAASNRIWVGTETRNPETRNSGYVQPTEGYVNFRWLASVAGSKIGGAWFDFGDCTAQNYVDQAYQSVLAGARELTLFSLQDLMRGHPGHPLLEAALPKLFELAEKVRGRPASGIAYYKPSSSDGEENLYLMEYLPMVGLPIVPLAQFPSGWPVIFLGSQAADRDLLARMKRELARGATLVLTPALLRRMDPQAANMAGVTVSPRLQPGVVGGLEVDLSLAVTRAQTRVSIPADGKPIPLLTMRKNGRGRILVANVRAFSAADWPSERSEKLFPPLRLGLPELAQPLADALRRDLLEPLKTSLAAPSKVAFYMLGDARVLYNFRNEPVEVKLDGRVIQIPANGLVWR